MNNHVVFIHSRLDDYGLPAAAFRVYCHLSRRGGRGAAYPSIGNMAQVCRLHPQTVRKSIKLLVKHNLVQIERRTGETSLYRLTPSTMWQPLTRIDGDPVAIDTPASGSQGRALKSMQEHPCESNVAKGNPNEFDPTKKTQTLSLPVSEEQAVQEGLLLGIPTEFTRLEFNRMESVGWLDGCRRPIQSWPHYLKHRWSQEQGQFRQHRSHFVGARKGNAPPPRQFTASDYEQSTEAF